MQMILRRALCFFIILAAITLYSVLSFADLGAPHFIYGKVLNSDNGIPNKNYIEIYAYIPSRPDEILDKSSAGCAYDVLSEGWLWFEAGNFDTPWSIGENLRVIVINNLLYETRAIDLILNNSGNQVLPDLTLAPGDMVGPIASNTLANGVASLTIPEETSTITVTATVNDTKTGNNTIKSAECYVDTDPGLGFGLSMDAGDGSFNSQSEDVEIVIDTSSWTAGTTHTIYVRGQDAADNWGAAHMAMVLVTSGEILWECPLSLGWNAVGLAVNLDNYTAQTTCEQINAQNGNIQEIDQFTAGSWSGHICGLPFNNFSLSFGKGYFILAGAESTWNQEGTDIPSPLHIDLRQGWNFICLPRWTEGIFDAQGLIDEIKNQGGSCQEIDQLIRGAWEGHIDGLPFNNFPIIPGKSYAVKCNASGELLIVDSFN